MLADFFVPQKRTGYDQSSAQRNLQPTRCMTSPMVSLWDRFIALPKLIKNGSNPGFKSALKAECNGCWSPFNEIPMGEVYKVCLN